MNYFLIDGRYDDLLRHYGLYPQAVLRQAELPADTLNHDPISMKEEQYYRFMQAIDELKTTDDLAVKMATTDQIETFSPPIFAAYCSHNGEQCIKRLAEYKKLIGPMTYQITSSADQVTVELLPGDASLKIPAFLAVAEWAFLIGLLRRATKQEVTPVKVVLNSAKPAPALAQFAGIKLESGSANQISFSKADLQRPFISYNAAMWNYFEPELTKRLADLEIDDSASARVRSALAELLPSGETTIDDVARELGVSKRTLQRKLKEEKTTFQKQLNSTRESLAVHYLSNTDITTNEIAFLLGYQELNSFLRAFSLWTGKTVSEYRRQHQDQTKANRG